MKKIFIIDKLNRVYLFSSVSVINPKAILCRRTWGSSKIYALYISEIKFIIREKGPVKEPAQKQRLWKALGM